VPSPTCRHLDQERALDIDRAAGHRDSRALAHRRTLAGEQRFVGAALAFDHPAVGRNRLARPDQHHLAGLQIGGQHLLAVTIRRIAGRRVATAGISLASASVTLTARWRAVISRKRPLSRKKTNIVTESK
jgi:hypothetical protein